MKLYFATSYSPFGELKKLKEWKVKKVLSTYYVLKNSKLTKITTDYHKEDFDLFLDSGAFSAFTKNININIDEYIDFIKQTENLWTLYAGLDVIGDYKRTRANVEYMESKGLKPLPTFHYGSPLAELRLLLEKYDYIALGGLVPLSLKKELMTDWLDTCFAVISKYWPKKIHGFGVNSAWIWQKYPFYSVDATSWNQGMKFGRVPECDGLNFKVKNKNPKYRGEFAKYNQATWQYRTEVIVANFLEMEQRITRLWESRGIKFK